ncbi:MAG: type II toxin-antitoxin system RelE/ParE family toxin [Bacteroidetes bacterium]|nr:type II toxin-antitoxin system RelE/ParE family toxin [Bacteroidota bacterium]
MFKIVIEPEAFEDINTACSYYYSLPIDTNKLVESFLDDLQIAFDALTINPLYPFKTKNFRALPLSKFPYILFFTVDDTTEIVIILALFNTHQDIGKYPEL